LIYYLPCKFLINQVSFGNNFLGVEKVVTIKRVFLIILGFMLLTGCGAKNKTETATLMPASKTPVMNTTVESPTDSAYPSVEENVPIINSEYPGPSDAESGQEVVTTPVNFVSNLVVPTPAPGKAVITGQLVEGSKDGKPFINALYLGSTSPASTPGYPPLVSYSEKSSQLAVQDVNTGRFLFTDVNPGQYAIIIWSPFGGNLLSDESGATILVTVNADEIKDLGVIPVK
jgi:hypothetical protein